MLLNSQKAQITAGSSKPAASFQVRRFLSRGVACTNPLREKRKSSWPVLCQMGNHQNPNWSAGNLKSIPQMWRLRWSWWWQVKVFYEGSAEVSWHPGTLLLCHFMAVAVCLSLISSWWEHEPFNPLILSLLKHTSRPRQDKYQQLNPTLRVIKG